MYFHANQFASIFCIIWPIVTSVDQWLPFEDIPIESYNHEHLDGDTIDGGELLPRLSRSSEDSSPDEDFFKFFRAYNSDSDTDSEASIKTEIIDIPKPGGLGVHYRASGDSTSRQRRALERSQDFDNTLRFPRMVILPPSAFSEDVSPVEFETRANFAETEPIAGDTLGRFTRSTKQDKSVSTYMKSGEKSVASTNKNSTDIDGNSRPKREHMQNDRSEEFSMETRDEFESLREARGAVTEQWIKQPYPVQAGDYDDNSALSSDNLKAPRVHFVTQRRSETASPPTFYRNYEREPRGRDLTREVPAVAREPPQRDLNREIQRDVRNSFRGTSYRDNYDNYQPRFTRNYDFMPFKRRGHDPYYYYDEQERYHHPRLDNYNPDRNKYTTYSANKQRRIIYYATLPEVVRSPPNVDLRDRYNYRDRYDDKFANSPVSQLDPFRFRKPYPKGRFEDDIERTKTPYPLKVSTDVNVREIKKNPERRIYSEVDRNRYGFKSPQYNSQTSYSNS